MDMSRMFRAGAYSAVADSAMTEDEKMRFVDAVCKKAESYEDDKPTWWDDNKGWALPLGVGIGSFLVGADAGRVGGPYGNHFANAGHLLLRRLSKLLGIIDDPYYNSFVKDKKYDPYPWHTDGIDNRDAIRKSRKGSLQWKSLVPENITAVA